MSLEPRVLGSLSADAVRPVILALDPFKVASTTKGKEQTMYSSGLESNSSLLLRPRMRDIRAAMLSTNQIPCIPLVDEALYASPYKLSTTPVVQFWPHGVTKPQKSQDEYGQHKLDDGLEDQCTPQEVRAREPCGGHGKSATLRVVT